MSADPETGWTQSRRVLFAGQKGSLGTRPALAASQTAAAKWSVTNPQRHAARFGCCLGIRAPASEALPRLV